MELKNNMINIVSRSAGRLYPSGPKKVIDNLIKGLDKIGYPYVINAQLDACTRLWIHDDVKALRAAVQLPEGVKMVVGPNLVAVPRFLPEDINLVKAVYIHPSKWAKAFWESLGFNACPIAVWPTGIDTAEFAPGPGTKSFVLVYYKERKPEELKLVIAVLEQKKIPYKVLRYPTYSQRAYKKLLTQSRYVVWVGRQESQGIALQEAMATNTPILVCDVSVWGQWHGDAKAMSQFTNEENSYEHATAAEYFDEIRCGIKIKDLTALPAALDKMESTWQNFKPREYVLNNLSLEKQARDFVEIYNIYFGLSFEAGKIEKQHHSGIWVNRNIWNATIFLMRDVAKATMHLARRAYGK